MLDLHRICIDLNEPILIGKIDFNSILRLILLEDFLHFIHSDTDSTDAEEISIFVVNSSINENRECKFFCFICIDVECIFKIFFEKFWIP